MAVSELLRGSSATSSAGATLVGDAPSADLDFLRTGATGSAAGAAGAEFEAARGEGAVADMVGEGVAVLRGGGRSARGLIWGARND